MHHPHFEAWRGMRFAGARGQQVDIRSGGIQEGLMGDPPQFAFLLPQQTLGVDLLVDGVAQLEPALRPVFIERVAQILGGHRDPDVGDVDRAIRAALCGLWTPPAVADTPRWSRNTPRFERASRRAW